MKLSTFTAGFSDYEYNLDYYHGKDIVHQGNMLKLDPAYSWDRINSKGRNKIRLAQKLEVEIKRVEGTPKDISDFRTVWFDANDDTLPDELGEDEIMYMAYLDGELVGGLILSPSSPTVLYMHNLGANEAGKKANIPSLLLWHAVEDLASSAYTYIDVGVSFRPNLYSFFKVWQTDSYPIIFEPPFIRPDIRLTPFSAAHLVTYQGSDTSKKAQEIIAKYFGDTYTILPRAINCLQAILQHLELQKDDEVAVYKPFDNEYITRCVSGPIEHCATMTRAITDRTKAVVVIHEFGFPYEDIKQLHATCVERGIPLIEDCAWSYGTMIDAGTRVGDVGEYAIYSLPKIMPVQYGGILKGLAISDDDAWNTYRMFDHFKREIIRQTLATHLPQLEANSEKRRANWHYLAELFDRDGYAPLTPLKEGVIPGAVVVQVGDIMQDSFARYETFGVEAGRYYPEQALFLPVHEQLDEQQLAYVYAVFRGQLNLCAGYSRGKNNRS